MPEENKPNFTVKDRRIFSQENENIDEKENADETKVEDSTKQEKSKNKPSDKRPDKEDAEACLPEINFPTFIMSLNASALVNLGIVENPVTGNKETNLSIAKQTIDILSMLEEKTRGNLSKDEEGMLKSILYDLRIIYVKEKK
ncbi:MAG: DUF1844 domain-containing protein [Pseudomonadota bacterium]